MDRVKKPRIHTHDNCDHRFEYCLQCNEVYCIDCGNYWVKKDLKQQLTISTTPYKDATYYKNDNDRY